MRLMVQQARRDTRVVYAWEEGGEFLLSPFRETRNGRRPIDRFNSRDEIEAKAAERGVVVEWLAS